MSSLVSNMVNQIAGKKPVLVVGDKTKGSDAVKPVGRSLRELLDGRRAKVLLNAQTAKVKAKTKPKPPAVQELSPEMKALSNRARVLRFLDRGPARFDEIQPVVQLTHRQLENVLYHLGMPENGKVVRERDADGKSIWRLAAGAAASEVMVTPPPEKHAKPKAAPDQGADSAVTPAPKKPVKPKVKSVAIQESVPGAVAEAVSLPPVVAPLLKITADVTGVASFAGSLLEKGEVPVPVAQILLRAASEIQALRVGGLKRGQVLVLSLEKL